MWGSGYRRQRRDGSVSEGGATWDADVSEGGATWGSGGGYRSVPIITPETPPLVTTTSFTTATTVLPDGTTAVETIETAHYDDGTVTEEIRSWSITASAGGGAIGPSRDDDDAGGGRGGTDGTAAGGRIEEVASGVGRGVPDSPPPPPIDRPSGIERPQRSGKEEAEVPDASSSSGTPSSSEAEAEAESSGGQLEVVEPQARPPEEERGRRESTPTPPPPALPERKDPPPPPAADVAVGGDRYHRFSWEPQVGD